MRSLAEIKQVFLDMDGTIYEGTRLYPATLPFLDFLKKQGIFDPEYTSMRVAQYLGTRDAGPSTGANYSKLMWAFFVFQQWFETYRR